MKRAFVRQSARRKADIERQHDAKMFNAYAEELEKRYHELETATLKDLREVDRLLVRIAGRFGRKR